MKIVVLILFCFVPLLKATSGLGCKQQDTCYCLLPNSSYIDIRPLANETFELLDTEGLYRYAINLCEPFSKYDECTDVYGCQYNNKTGKFNSLGKTSPTFIDVQTLKLENDTTVVYIKLVCSKQEDVFYFASKFFDISPFNFTLESKYACPINTSTASTSTSNPNITSSSTAPATSSPTTTQTGSTNTTVVTISSATPTHPSSSTVTTSHGTTAVKTTLTTHHSTATSLSSLTIPLIGAVAFISKLLI